MCEHFFADRQLHFVDSRSAQFFDLSRKNLYMYKFTAEYFFIVDMIVVDHQFLPICTPEWRGRHCETEVSCPRTQYNYPSQVSNPDCFIQSPTC